MKMVAQYEKRVEKNRERMGMVVKYEAKVEREGACGERLSHGKMVRDLLGTLRRERCGTIDVRPRRLRLPDLQRVPDLIEHS